jgi:hypothetical protein
MDQEASMKKNDSPHNPVANLREKFLEKKKLQRPSDALKETLKKKEAPSNEDAQKKAAKHRDSETSA